MKHFIPSTPPAPPHPATDHRQPRYLAGNIAIARTLIALVVVGVVLGMIIALVRPRPVTVLTMLGIAVGVLFVFNRVTYARELERFTWHATRFTYPVPPKVDVPDKPHEQRYWRVNGQQQPVDWDSEAPVEGLGWPRAKLEQALAHMAKHGIGEGPAWHAPVSPLSDGEFRQLREWLAVNGYAQKRGSARNAAWQMLRSVDQVLDDLGLF